MAHLALEPVTHAAVAASLLEGEPDPDDRARFGLDLRALHQPPNSQAPFRSSRITPCHRTPPPSDRCFPWLR
jgi:hypothetical protein